jgi:hypothetical protein
MARHGTWREDEDVPRGRLAPDGALLAQQVDHAGDRDVLARGL